MNENRLRNWNSIAQQYADYAFQPDTQYARTARELVQLSDIQRGMRVVDLACGPGNCSAIILNELHEDGQVIGIDFSPAMVAIAQSRVLSPIAKFHVSEAEEIDQVLNRPVDRIVCNAAFWKFDQHRVLEAIRKSLVRGGRLLFNINSRYFQFDDGYERPEIAILQRVQTELGKRGCHFSDTKPS